MRISTAYAFSLNTSALLDKQSRLSELQQQLATGRRILTPADDPAGANRALQASQGLARTQNHLNNMDVATSRLKQELTILNGAKGVLDAARAAVMGVQSGTDMALRRDVANHLSELLQDLLAYANSRDSNGDYYFAGSLAGSAPFSAGPPVTYAGNSFQLEIAISDSRRIPVADPGDAVFSMGTANDPFAALNQLITDLQYPSLTDAAYTAAISAGLDKLVAAADQVRTIQNAVANRLDVIDAAGTIAIEFRRQFQDELQRVERVDLQQVAVELQLQQVSLQASQQAFARASQLSLFNYL